MERKNVASSRPVTNAIGMPTRSRRVAADVLLTPAVGLSDEGAPLDRGGTTSVNSDTGMVGIAVGGREGSPLGRKEGSALGSGEGARDGESVCGVEGPADVPVRRPVGGIVIAICAAQAAVPPATGRNKSTNRMPTIESTTGCAPSCCATGPAMPEGEGAYSVQVGGTASA